MAADAGREVSGVAGLVSRSIDVVQGFKVLGHHRVERALPIDTRLTAIGELVNTSPTVCSQPFVCCLKLLLRSGNCLAEETEGCPHCTMICYHMMVAWSDHMHSMTAHADCTSHQHVLLSAFK